MITSGLHDFSDVYIEFTIEYQGVVYHLHLCCNQIFKHPVLIINICAFSLIGMRQGNDVGTTYRSTIYAHTQEQLDQALRSKDEYQKVSLNRPVISLPSIYKQPSGDQFVSQWFKTGLASGSRHYIGHQAPKAKMSLKILLVA